MTSIRTTRVGALVCALLVASAAGCSRSTTSPGQWAGELAAAKGRWRAAAVSNYTFGLQRTCYCTANQTRPVTVTVRNGALIRIVYADSTGGYADTTLFQPYLTIDRYFTLLDQVIASGPANFTATYSPSLGFPITVVVDPSGDYINDEFTVEMLSFKIDTP